MLLAGIKEEVAAQGRPTNLSFEFLNRSQFPADPPDAAWAAFLAAKYRQTRPDVIIADAAPAIRFIAGFGPRVFGPVPVIGILPHFDGMEDVEDAVTVKVTTGPHITRTVEMALAQRPDTRKVVIVSDDGPQSHHLAEIIQEALARRADSKIQVDYLFDFRLEDLEHRLAALPDNSIVFYTHVYTDKTGQDFRPEDVAARLARVSAAPIYVLFDTDIGTGVVGGVVNNPRLAGRAAIRSALEMLRNGGRPSPQSEAPYSSQMVVDWRQLRRWKISEDKLPPEADIRFRQPSLFETYYYEALLVLACIAALSGALVLISFLFMQRGRLTQALQETNSRLEERVAARTHDLETASAQMQAFLEFSPVPALITGQGRVRMANRRFLSLFGGTAAEISDFEFWWSRSHADPAHGPALLAEWNDRLQTARRLGVPIAPMTAHILCRDGTVRTVQIHAVPLDDRLVIQFIDMTERHRMEEELRHIAFHDSLTRLPNRRLLLDRLEQAVHAGKHRNSYFAVLFLDLNKFKKLNDTHGHDVGDMLLMEVANRLQKAVRDGDTVARLGGDEFVVLLEGLGNAPDTALAHARTVAEKIRQSLSSEYGLGTIRYVGSASIGIKLCREEDDDPDLILKDADTAMYEAKKGRPEHEADGPA